MWFVYLICTALCLAYCTLILLYRYWFKRLQPVEAAQRAGLPTFFTVIIPARNESANIAACLQSVIANTYPPEACEIIVIDDFSTDDTAAQVAAIARRHPQVSLLKMDQLIGNTTLPAHKKKAIELAIGRAKGSWIVTTDADCLVPAGWLRQLHDYIQQHNPVLVAAPVSFINTHTFLGIFQCLDFMSLQGITAASVSAGFHSMCNGANLAYRKKAFEQVGGFSGIDNIASGDDMLLMEKMNKEFAGRIGFLYNQNSIVQTMPMLSWSDFINQRIRWASKTGRYTDKKIIAVLGLVYLFNASLLLLLIAAIFIPSLLVLWISLLLAKTLCELSFMIPVARFFNQTNLLRWFAPMQPVHITYTVVAGWLGLFGSYRWKGRTVH